MQREDKRISELEQINKYPNQDDLLIIFNKEAGEAGETQSMEFSRLPEGGGVKVTSVNGRIDNVILDKSDVGLDNVDNTSDMDKPVSTAVQEALDIIDGGGTNLIDSIDYPHFSAHRGGLNLFPESSLEAYERAFNSNFSLECDVRSLADGTLVLLHDSTVDRTMTGISGNVSELSQYEWRGARIKPVIKGGRTGTPLMFSELLDKFGGRSLLVPELKDYSVANRNKLIDMITQRRLTNSVIVQCFDYDTCVALASAGIRTMFLVGTSTTVTPEDMRGDGIEFFGARWDIDQSLLEPFIAAGYSPWAYTVNTVERFNVARSKGFAAVFSDDPWWVSQRYNLQSFDPFSTGYGWPGIKNVYSRNTTPRETLSADYDSISLAGRAIDLQMQQSSTSGGLMLSYARWAGKITRPCRITLSIDWLDTDVDTQSYSAGFAVYNNDNDFEADFYDSANPGQKGFTVAARRNGMIQAWSYVDGASATSLGQLPALTGSNQDAPEMMPGHSRFAVEFTQTQIKLIDYQRKRVEVIPNSYDPGEMTLILRTTTITPGGAVQKAVHVQIYDVRVEDI